MLILLPSFKVYNSTSRKITSKSKNIDIKMYKLVHFHPALAAWRVVMHTTAVLID